MNITYSTYSVVCVLCRQIQTYDIFVQKFQTCQILKTKYQYQKVTYKSRECKSYVTNVISFQQI